MKSLLIAMLFALPFLGNSQSPIYVAPGADGDGQSATEPIDLQGALDLARSNGVEDLIYLSQGTYINSPYSIDYNDPSTDLEPIYLSGGWNDGFSESIQNPQLTTLAGGAGRIFTLLADEIMEDRVFGLLNLSLVGATSADLNGAGIGVEGSDEAEGTVNLEIEQVIFLNNTATGTGSGGALFTAGGFTLSDCHFNGNGGYNGGAIYVEVYENTTDRPRIIRRSTFENNEAWQGGSSIFTNGPNLEIEDCTFLGMEDGSSSGPGSGIFAYHNSHTRIDRCRFEGIRIDFWGSALQAWNGSMDIANSLFIDCESGLNNGYGAFSYYHGNGIEDREIYISNCTFSGNQSQGGSFGSAIHFRGNGGDAIYVANSIFWNQGLNAMYKESGSAFITHVLSDFDPLGFSIAEPMFNSDPLFEGGFQIGANSPALDAGNTTYIDENWLDYDGGIRLLGEHPDLGAYEYNAPPEDVLVPMALLTENNDPDYNLSNIDTEGQEGDVHVFSLADGNGSNDADNDKFYIVDEQLFIGESANYEVQSSYSIYLKAVDSDDQEVETAIVIEVMDENDPPVYLGGLLDQTGVVGELSTFSIEAGLFSDEDEGDELAFSATLSNGDPLPAWLSFDEENLQFTGTPVQEEVLEITLTATDEGGLEAAGDFEFDISPLGLIDIERASIQLYPNPAREFIRFDWPAGEGFYAIYDLTGKLVDEGNIRTENLQIDVRNLESGTYILTLYDENTLRSGKFMVE